MHHPITEAVCWLGCCWFSGCRDELISENSPGGPEWGGCWWDRSWAGTGKTFIVVVVEGLQHRTSAAGSPSTSGDRGATDERLSKFLYPPLGRSAPRETRLWIWPPSVVSTPAPVSWGTWGRRWRPCRRPSARVAGPRRTRTWRPPKVTRARKCRWGEKSRSSMASASSWATWLALGSLSLPRACSCAPVLTDCPCSSGLSGASSRSSALCPTPSWAPPSPSPEPATPTSWSPSAVSWPSSGCGRPSSWSSRPTRRSSRSPSPTTWWRPSTPPARRPTRLSGSSPPPASVSNPVVFSVRSGHVPGPASHVRVLGYS